MSSSVARKGDTDNLTHTIQSAVQDGVLIDGIPVAVKGSMMDDGTAITGGVIEGILINGIPLAVVGSTTEPHINAPGKLQSGTINTGDDGVQAS
jgi:uncharacterized Zn-binding protein involved in type VI secretion